MSEILTETYDCRGPFWLDSQCLTFPLHSLSVSSSLPTGSPGSVIVVSTHHIIIYSPDGLLPAPPPPGLQIYPPEGAHLRASRHPWHSTLGLTGCHCQQVPRRLHLHLLLSAGDSHASTFFSVIVTVDGYAFISLVVDHLLLLSLLSFCYCCYCLRCSWCFCCFSRCSCSLCCSCHYRSYFCRCYWRYLYSVTIFVTVVSTVIDAVHFAIVLDVLVGNSGSRPRNFFVSHPFLMSSFVSFLSCK